MNQTSIEWTDYTSTPLRYRRADGTVVWACEKVSKGCAHCYAEALALRYGRGALFNAGEMDKLAPFVDRKEVRTLLTSTKLAGQRCFLNDMTDWMGAWVPDDMVDEMVAVMALRRDVTWQVLTKRVDRQHDYLSGLRVNHIARLTAAARRLGRAPTRDGTVLYDWPLPNVIWMCSIEDQESADARLPVLRATPGMAHRGVSYEPALGPVDLWGHLSGIDWLIWGGESGTGAREARVVWAYEALRACRGAGTRFFLKQLGSRPVQRVVYGPVDFSGEQPVHSEPLRLASRKGGDMAEWPPDLRVREFPLMGGAS